MPPSINLRASLNEVTSYLVDILISFAITRSGGDYTMID